MSNPFGWTLPEMEAWVASRGHRPYRARQLAHWLYARGEDMPAAMRTVPGDLRRALAGGDAPFLPRVAARRESTDGTRKFLLELADGETVEMVVIPEGRRRTLCLSTQVGCAVGCLFCGTGRGGLKRGLAAAEMVGEVILARREAASPGNLTNLVFMGMGEPLLNFEALARAMEIIAAPWGLAFSQRRLTVSTAGVAPNLGRLRSLFPAVNVAVSLNAADDRLRARLMPGVRRWKLGELLAAVDALPGGSRHPVTLEYVLIGGVNDRPADIAGLKALMRGRDLQLNLIPCHDVPGSDLGPPPPGAAEAFAASLRRAGIKVLLRRSRGADIEAACGQLRAAVPGTGGR